jgi:uncharacterized protein
MAGKFVLKKGSTGKYHFNLVATNGQVIATSEAYERKQSALSGIESVKKNAPDAEIEDQTEDLSAEGLFGRSIGRVLSAGFRNLGALPRSTG